VSNSGTSASSPTFAAIVSLLNDAQSPLVCLRSLPQPSSLTKGLEGLNDITIGITLGAAHLASLYVPILFGS